MPLSGISERWYEEGYQAFLDGKRAVDCPGLDYDLVAVPTAVYDSLSVRCWSAGWLDAMWSVVSKLKSGDTLDIKVNLGAQVGTGKRALDVRGKKDAD